MISNRFIFYIQKRLKQSTTKMKLLSVQKVFSLVNTVLLVAGYRTSFKS